MRVVVSVIVLLTTVTLAFAISPLAVRNGKLVNAKTGKPIGLFGVNLFETHLGWAVRQDVAEMERNLEAIAKCGFNAIRVPMNMSYIEPAPNVFPDDAQYSEIMHKHRLKDGFPKFLDALVKKAGELGLYVIFEFHELPSDPWRYFAGGNEQLRKTGKHGGAISWMANLTLREDGTIEKVELDWEKAIEHVPKALAWLARRYKGNPIVAAIEVPWNEPIGGLANEEESYFKLVKACAAAVKGVDKNRLVFMDTQDWGACVNFLPPSSCWRVPDEVDALFPHFYFGMHCPNMPFEISLNAAAANWVSWFLAYGKPVLVGEYGIAGLDWKSWLERNKEVLQKRYQLFGEKPMIGAFYADVLRACLEQWLKMGVQGVFYWAWWEGIPGMAAPFRERTYALTHGHEVLMEFAPKFQNISITSADAKVVVICEKERRAQYGDPRDLAAISNLLIAANVVPYHVIFVEALLGDQRWLRQLKRYQKVIILADGLREGCIELVGKFVEKGRTFIVRQGEANWQINLQNWLKNL
ncbi:MAG: cellulase family glycosylhydrolase [Armatimonadota bacterium]|nr:glycoside hydrolase family 5 protein [Armatimonadota bacterium]MCX7778190.1 glycoside hydrolase family 5 protein [Armatimonadota bacterium]MDW8026217.1 cellulase family glycosylhydrolase [Armatimonadota bacterium]